MGQNTFKTKIEKQLWFLNKKERSILHSELESLNAATFKAQYRTQNQFVISFLSRHVYNDQPKSQLHLLTTLLGLMIANTLLLGILITGLLLSLSSIKYFITPTATLGLNNVILIFISSIIMIVIAVVFIKPVNGYLTKRLIDFKLNRLT